MLKRTGAGCGTEALVGVFVGVGPLTSPHGDAAMDLHSFLFRLNALPKLGVKGHSFWSPKSNAMLASACAHFSVMMNTIHTYKPISLCLFIVSWDGHSPVPPAAFTQSSTGEQSALVGCTCNTYPNLETILWYIMWALCTSCIPGRRYLSCP